MILENMSRKSDKISQKVHCGLCSHFMDDDCNLCGCSRYDGPVDIKESRIVSMRSRNPDNPSDRTAGMPTEQRLEPNSQGICNTLTSVQKDNMVLESAVTTQGKDVAATIRACMSKCGLANVERNCEMGSGFGYEGVIEPTYRIRKLTPLECWRLMGFSDEDFQKAEKVNSNTQLYKQAGNSIVVDALKAIFRQMLPERTQNK